MAFQRSYPGSKKRFLDYAVLGDDVVIADSRVAQEYRSILDTLSVGISESKSLVSHEGCMEFAKRFVVWGKKDISPYSLRLLRGVQFDPYGPASVALQYGIEKK